MSVVCSPALRAAKLKRIYCARKCRMEEGFFCDMLGWLQLFQFSFVYLIRCNVLFAYRILFSIFWKEFGWVLFLFHQAGLDLAIEVILQV